MSDHKPDLIDRSQLKPDLGDANVEYGSKPIHYSQDAIQSAPAVEAKSVRLAEKIIKQELVALAFCGECGVGVQPHYNYCPICGAMLTQSTPAAVPTVTLYDLVSRYSGDRKLKLYECRHSIIGDGAPYPWPEQDLIDTWDSWAGKDPAFWEREVYRWEIVGGYLCAVVGFIRSDFDKHY